MEPTHQTLTPIGHRTNRYACASSYPSHPRLCRPICDPCLISVEWIRIDSMDQSQLVLVASEVELTGDDHGHSS